jgi:hypothetical protein
MAGLRLNGSKLRALLARGGAVHLEGDRAVDLSRGNAASEWNGITQAPQRSSPFLERLRSLFGADPITLYAADQGNAPVEERHVDEALHDLVVQGGPLTASLLGGKPTLVQ